MVNLKKKNHGNIQEDIKDFTICAKETKNPGAIRFIFTRFKAYQNVE